MGVLSECICGRKFVETDQKEGCDECQKDFDSLEASAKAFADHFKKLLNKLPPHSLIHESDEKNQVRKRKGKG